MGIITGTIIGIYDICLKVSNQYYRSKAKRLLKKVNEKVSVVDSTIDPDVYFPSHEELLQLLKKLSNSKRCHRHLTGGLPTRDLERAMDTKNDNAAFFIRRVIAALEQAVLNSETFQIKQDKIAAVRLSMEKYMGVLHDSNRLNFQESIKDIEDGVLSPDEVRRIKEYFDQKYAQNVKSFPRERMLKTGKSLGQLSNGKIDFVATRGGDKLYIQVTQEVKSEKTEQREYERLLGLKDNYPKYVLRTDEFAGGNYEGIKSMHIADFLLSNEY